MSKFTLPLNQDYSADPKHFEESKLLYEKEMGEPFDISQEEFLKVLHSHRMKIEYSGDISLGVLASTVSNGELIKVIKSMHWTFLRAQENAMFYTSDTPVVLNNFQVNRSFEWGGLALPGTFFTFPLARDLCMVASWSGSDIHIPVDRPIVIKINQLTLARAYRFIYSPFRGLLTGFDRKI